MNSIRADAARVGVPLDAVRLYDSHKPCPMTVLGEPALKMLRYQQQYTFFDSTQLNNAIRFMNLSQESMDGGLKAVLEK
jgi:hypothetical protein